MRYVDLALAALIGTSCITGIFAWNPRAWDSTSSSLELQTHLRDGLLGILQNRGIVWLMSSPPVDVCAALQSVSNSSVTYSAVLGDYSCRPFPTPSLPDANLTLNLIPFKVVLESWSSIEE